MLELQQEREQTVVLVRAAVGDDDVQWPVHLGRVGGGGGVKRCECERKQRNTKLELERGKKSGVRERDVQVETLIKEVRGL